MSEEEKRRRTEELKKAVEKELTRLFEEENIDKDVVEKLREKIKPEEVEARRRGVRCGVIGRVDNLYVYACRYSYNFFVLFPLYLQVVHKGKAALRRLCRLAVCQRPGSFRLIGS